MHLVCEIIFFSAHLSHLNEEISSEVLPPFETAVDLKCYDSGFNFPSSFYQVLVFLFFFNVYLFGLLQSIAALRKP